MTKAYQPEQIDDAALDEVSGGPIEIRELHIRSTVDEDETEGALDPQIKTRKIWLRG